MVRLHPYSDGTPRSLSTVCFERARLAISHREFDLDHLIVVAIDGGRPAQTFLLGGTPGFLRLPINLKTAGVKALFLFPLPLVINSGRGDQIDAILLAALHKLFGLCII